MLIDNKDNKEQGPVSLFLFAHQDDEFGVFQKLIDEQRRGRRVLCAYLTDGASHGKSASLRNEESVAVLKHLGVQEDNIFFAGAMLSIPDGGLPERLEKAIDWMTCWLSHFSDIQVIYLPAWEGGHHDHDALHAIGVVVAEKFDFTKKVRQFPLYNRYKCVGPFFRVLLPLPLNGGIEAQGIPWINRLLFLRYCLSYPSQKSTWMGLFPFVMLHYLFKGTQVHQPVSLKRIAYRPHEGPLYYEKRGFYTWEKMSDRIASVSNATGSS